MTTEKPTCLIVDDEPDLLAFIASHLEKMGIKVDCTDTVTDAKNLLAHRHYDFCLSDMRLPDGNGLDLVKHIAFQHAGLPIAIMTAFANPDNAVSALKGGAFDYLSKPIELPQLQALAKAALKHSQSNNQKNAKISLLGHSPAISQLRVSLEKMAHNTAPLLITGELGTGKETAARLVHLNSTRSEFPFIKVNCASMSDDSAAHDFFAYPNPPLQKAKIEADSFLRSARGGTLFLDHVDKLAPNMQTKLVDCIHDENINIRFVAASHLEIGQLKDEAHFNQDLFYRLNVMSLHMPALRDIREDIPIIAQHLMLKIADCYAGPQKILSDCALQRLMSCRFLGNVRELRNTLERAYSLCDGNEITAEDLNIKAKKALAMLTQAQATELSLPEYLESIEKQAIREALSKTNQNKTAAAKLLGVSFRTLRYRLAKLGLSKGDKEIDDS